MVRTIWANCSLQILLILKKKVSILLFWVIMHLAEVMQWAPSTARSTARVAQAMCLMSQVPCQTVGALQWLVCWWHPGAQRPQGNGYRVNLTLLTYTQLLVSNRRRTRLIYSISFPNSGPNSWRVDISVLIYLPGAGHNRQGHLAEVISGFLQLSQLHHRRGRLQTLSHEELVK